MKKIAVIGSVNMDLTAKAERHPQKGETVSGWDLQYIPGGKGANQAVAAARLGGDVRMFGCVGGDIFAQQLVENLRVNGVDTAQIDRVPDVSSGIAMITVAEKDNSIVVIPGANHHVTPAYLKEREEAVLEADIILLQNEIPLETVDYAIEIAGRAGKVIIYNPAPVVPLKEGVMEKVSFLTPNEHEVQKLFPEKESLESLLKAQKGRLIVTLGSDGVAAWDEGKVIRVPARHAEVADTTGAGDTFNGAFAFAIANEYPLKKALRFANTAASLSTEKFGAQGGMPDYDAVLRNLDNLPYFNG